MGVGRGEDEERVVGPGTMARGGVGRARGGTGGRLQREVGNGLRGHEKKGSEGENCRLREQGVGEGRREPDGGRERVLGAVASGEGSKDSFGTPPLLTLSQTSRRSWRLDCVPQ